MNELSYAWYWVKLRPYKNPDCIMFETEIYTNCAYSAKHQAWLEYKEQDCGFVRPNMNDYIFESEVLHDE